MPEANCLGIKLFMHELCFETCHNDIVKVTIRQGKVRRIIYVCMIFVEFFAETRQAVLIVIFLLNNDQE